MNATVMSARATTSRSSAVSCRAAPAGHASAAVVAPLRRSAAAGSNVRRNASSSSSKLNGAAVANASSKTLAVERVRSDEDEDDEDYGEGVFWSERDREKKGFFFHRRLAPFSAAHGSPSLLFFLL